MKQTRRGFVKGALTVGATAGMVLGKPSTSYPSAWPAPAAPPREYKVAVENPEYGYSVHGFSGWQEVVPASPSSTLRAQRSTWRRRRRAHLSGPSLGRG